MKLAVNIFRVNRDDSLLIQEVNYQRILFSDTSPWLCPWEQNSTTLQRLLFVAETNLPMCQRIIPLQKDYFSVVTSTDRLTDYNYAFFLSKSDCTTWYSLPPLQPASPSTTLSQLVSDYSNRIATLKKRDPEPLETWELLLINCDVRTETDKLETLWRLAVKDLLYFQKTATLPYKIANTIASKIREVSEALSMAEERRMLNLKQVLALQQKCSDLLQSIRNYEERQLID